MKLKELIRKIVKQVKNLCIEYFNGGCAFKPEGEKTCLYQREAPLKELRCPYYELAVLGDDKELEEAYWREIMRDEYDEMRGDVTPVKAKKKTKKKKGKKGTCKGCNNDFIKFHHNTKYCEDCKVTRTRKSKRDYINAKRAV